MTTSMLDAQWSADPTQPGRIAAGEAITIEVTVNYIRVPGDEAGPDRIGKAMRLVKATEALVVAAPAMAKMLRRIWNAHHGQDGAEDMEQAMLEAETILSSAGVSLP